MSAFQKKLRSGARLLFDGALGTMLQARGLAPGQNPDSFCLEHPAVLKGIHCEYARAGATVLTTNTFGGTRFKLPKNIEPVAFNRSMARIARAVAEESGAEVFVAGDVGPSGHFLRPLGELEFEDLVSGYREQIRGLIQGGVDFILAETQFDIAEARAIVIAARREGDLPVAVSMTYEAGRTLTGSDVSVCVATLANMGVDLIGMNCSAGPVEMREAASLLLETCPVPVLIEPNAGLPELKNGETIFPLTPAPFAELTAAFAREGAQAVGGCCGTTPEHIACLAKAIAGLPPVAAKSRGPGIVLTSRSSLLRIGPGTPVRVIGERINPTGKKQLTAELQAGEFTTALRFADEQVAAGAPVLDVNVGAPMVNEGVCLPELVLHLVARHGVPLSIDSADKEAVARALAAYPASPLVNSISGEPGHMERLGPICRDYGAPFILLPLKGKKLPELAGERIAILDELLARMDELGVPRRLAMVDALVLTVSSNPDAARECLAFIRHCSGVLGLPVTCGLSNVSFGLPARELLNASFLSLAAGAGMNCCIANPANARITEAVDAANLLLGHDPGAESFIRRYSGWQSGESGPASPASAPLERSGPLSIEDAVIAGRVKEIGNLVQAALAQGEDPFTLVNRRLIPAITEVGAKYERKEYFLPQLIRSAEAMQAAFALLKPLLEKDARTSERPVIVTATVEGDIHDIGKNIVNLMLGNHGFEVVDLGKDVPAHLIVREAAKRKAALIGLSALMTTTMVRMADTVELVRSENLGIPVMVGGAVVTDEYAKSIGAHYSGDAVDAVRLAKSLLG